MEVKILYRIPDLEHSTIMVGDVPHIVDIPTYASIIKDATRVDGSVKDYLEARNKLIIDYFYTNPKEQFSW